MTAAQRSLRARIAAHKRWEQEPDRVQATAKARAAARSRFERQVDPDGLLDPAERATRARHAERAHLLSMSLKRIS